MKLGAEPKKVAALAGLLAVAAVVYYTSREEGAPQQTGSRASARPPATPNPGRAARPPEPELAKPDARSAARSQRSRRTGVEDWRPVLKPKRPEERPDPASIDPTLRLDLLARLSDIKREGGDRSLFEFTQAPPAKNPDPPKIIPKTADPAGAQKAPDSAPAKPAEAPKPPPPPIPLKFYGAHGGTNQVGKSGFFLEGEEIYVAAEGELIKKRYKVIKLGLKSAVLEDTEHKHQQTLPLEEQTG